MLCPLSVVNSRGNIFNPIIMKLRQNVCLDEISDDLKMGHVSSKTKSLGQILEKPCLRSKGYIFQSDTHKTYGNQNVGLIKISDKFENVSYWVKN